MNPVPASLPRLLLVEDDPVSAAFLRDAAATLPARVDVAGSLAEARALAAEPHDLLLVDANLPDGSGPALLRALRDAGIATPALAHTADADPALHARLRAAGFVDVLVKPLGASGLRAALRARLPGWTATRPDWDDAAALAAVGGQQAHVDALRGLFLKELPAQRERIEAAATAGDETAIRVELHRLAASCGFVGAARLADAVRALQVAPLDAGALQALRDAVAALPPPPV